jgi:hypothetical protein
MVVDGVCPMYLAPNFQGNQPITWWGRVPVYLTTILTAILAGGIVLMAVAGAMQVNVGPLAFTPEGFLRGFVWQPLTYPLLNDLSFFTPFLLWCFYAWGVEIEKYLGRPRYFVLFLVLVLLPPVLCLAGYGLKIAPWDAHAAGTYEIAAGLLIGFATLYPGIEYFGWVPLKWFAFACVAAGSLMDLAQRNFWPLVVLWGECLAAWGYIRWLQHGGEVRWPAWSRLFRRRPKLRVLPDPDIAHADAVASEVDDILEKISRTGMASLSAEERRRLEHARSKILRREGQ